MPSLRHETDHGHAPDHLVCGVDEAGRGPLAGPVVAAAVILPCVARRPKWARGIDDSKALTPDLRAELHDTIRLHAAAVGVGIASVEEIDRLNILRATFLAMRRAVEALTLAPKLALVDGNQAPELPCRVAMLVGGDGISLSIAAASIVAKVTRDRLMKKLAEAHPYYGWERNAGYGTKEHLLALKAHGATPHHRRSFAPVSEQLSLTI